MNVASYHEAHDQLDAIYASGRLRLPFEGVLLFGYQVTQAYQIADLLD